MAIFRNLFSPGRKFEPDPVLSPSAFGADPLRINLTVLLAWNLTADKLSRPQA